MSHRRRPTLKVAMLLAVAMLLIAGAVVTATAAPGPATDVKTAQYGAPPVTSGPCKGLIPDYQADCLRDQERYKAAKRACAKKKPGKKRKACLKKLKRDYPKFAK